MEGKPSRPSSGAVGWPTLVAALCGVIVIIGVLLPWFEFKGFSIPGLDMTRQGIETSDGKVVITLAVVGILALIIARGRRWGAIVQLVMAAIIAIIAIADIANPITDGGPVASAVEDNIAIKPGIWLVFLAGLVWLAVSIRLTARPARRASADSEIASSVGAEPPESIS